MIAWIVTNILMGLAAIALLCGGVWLLTFIPSVEDWTEAWTVFILIVLGLALAFSVGEVIRLWISHLS